MSVSVSTPVSPTPSPTSAEVDARPEEILAKIQDLRQVLVKLAIGAGSALDTTLLLLRDELFEIVR